MARMRMLLSQIDQVSAGEVVYPPGGRLGPRWQRDVQLVLVHAGSAWITVDGRPRATLEAGVPSACCFPATASISRSRPTGRPATRGCRRGSPTHRWIGLRRLPAALPASTALTELMREAVAVARTPLSTAEPLLAALAAAALWRYAGEAESLSRGVGEPVDRARRFLHDHLADPSVDLDQVARAAHVTPAHLVRRFKAELGVTPIAYLWQRRVATGIDLLAQTGLPSARSPRAPASRPSTTSPVV